MAIRKILKFPDQDLRIKAKPVESFDDELKTLTDDMFDTMHSVNGIGLAATQIGVAKQVAVIDISPEKNEPLVIVNPAIQILDPSKTEDYDEGCLSVPGFFDYIPANLIFIFAWCFDLFCVFFCRIVDRF